MSFYDIDRAGQIDPIGSQPIVPVDTEAREYGPLDPELGDKLPDSDQVILSGGVGHAVRSVYALRLAMAVADGRPIRYWVESDFLAQKDRLRDRKGWAARGDIELVNEYEANRMQVDEFESCSLLIFDGLGGRAGSYQGWQVEQITSLLYRRLTIKDAVTIVVPVEMVLTDFRTFPQFKYDVDPYYAVWDL